MTRITVACLDMAGTTVADDGTVMEAFTAAITEQNLPEAAYQQAMTDVRSSMGQSKIEVFRRILGDEETAQKANEAFEDHYAAAVAPRRDLGRARRRGHDHAPARGRRPGLPGHRLLPGHQGRDHRQARLGRADRPGPVPRRRGPRPAAWPDLPLTALLRLRGGAVGELAVAGDTSSDIESGLRAGAAVVAGVLTGANSRADLEQAGVRSYWIRSRTDCHFRHGGSGVTGRHGGRRGSSGGRVPGPGRQRDRYRGPGSQRASLGTRLVDLDGDIAVQQDADLVTEPRKVRGHHPVAVRHELHPQPLGPYKHIYCPVSPPKALWASAGLYPLTPPSS